MMAGFGLPNFSQFTEAFQKAQQIQKDAVRLQEELDTLILEGSSEDGRVRVTISGNQVPQGVVLDPGLLAEEPHVVEAAVLEALQASISTSTCCPASRNWFTTLSRGSPESSLTRSPSPTANFSNANWHRTAFRGQGTPCRSRPMMSMVFEKGA